MPADHDYYNVLGVARTADADEIKRAYRALAMRWHPDRNPGDAVAERRFKALTDMPSLAACSFREPACCKVACNSLSRSCVVIHLIRCR